MKVIIMSKYRRAMVQVMHVLYKEKRMYFYLSGRGIVGYNLFHIRQGSDVFIGIRLFDIGE